jgi:hypothetical protein
MLFVQDNTQKRIVNVDTTIVTNEAQFPEFIHEHMFRERVVPMISASAS